MKDAKLSRCWLTSHSLCVHVYVNERCKQGNKNNKVKRHNTPKAVTFPKNNDRTHDTPHSRQGALPAELPRQLSWLGLNFTSQSAPDEQAYYQFNMKEKAGVMKPPKTPN